MFLSSSNRSRVGTSWVIKSPSILLKLQPWRDAEKSHQELQRQQGADASTDGLGDALTVPRSLGKGTPLILKQPHE